VPVGAVGVLPPFIQDHGVQYFTANNGDRLFDNLPHVRPEMVVCDTAAVVLDGVGDSITYEKSIGNADNYKIILEARIGTILPGSGSEQLFYVKGSSTHVTYLTKAGRYVDGTGIERVYFVVRNGANNGYYTLKVRASVLANYSNKFSTYVFELKNNHLSWTADGDPIKDMNIGNHRKGGSFLRFGCSNGPSAYASIQIKSIKVVADGVVVIDSKCEEGSGDLCLNAADGNNHGKLNSAAAGIFSMRNATANQVESHNAKFGCCKVSGTYYGQVPNDEFVYIPANENGIAQDPTMVPIIELSVDGINFYPSAVLNQVSNSHAFWDGFYESGIPDVLSGQNVNFYAGHWGMSGDMSTLEFVEPQYNQYPPRGTFDVIDTDDGDKPYSLTIRYTHPSIDDTGTIVKTNLHCLPGKVHNGANYLITEASDATPAPTYSALYDNTGTPLRLGLEDFQLLNNSEKDTTCKFAKGGVANDCYLAELVITEEGTIDGLTDEQRDQLELWMGALDCSITPTPPPDKKTVFLTADGSAFLTSELSIFIVKGE